MTSLAVDSVILDVATGAGTIPELLGEHLVAMDVTYDILKAGKNICKANWVCGDAREMPLRSLASSLSFPFDGKVSVDPHTVSFRTSSLNFVAQVSQKRFTARR